MREFPANQPSLAGMFDNEYLSEQNTRMDQELEKKRAESAALDAELRKKRAQARRPHAAAAPPAPSSPQDEQYRARTRLEVRMEILRESLTSLESQLQAKREAVRLMRLELAKGQESPPSPPASPCPPPPAAAGPSPSLPAESPSPHDQRSVLRWLASKVGISVDDAVAKEAAAHRRTIAKLAKARLAAARATSMPSWINRLVYGTLAAFVVVFAIIAAKATSDNAKLLEDRHRLLLIEKKYNTMRRWSVEDRLWNQRFVDVDRIYSDPAANAEDIEYLNEMLGLF